MPTRNRREQWTLSINGDTRVIFLIIFLTNFLFRVLQWNGILMANDRESPLITDFLDNILWRDFCCSHLINSDSDQWCAPHLDISHLISCRASHPQHTCFNLQLCTLITSLMSAVTQDSHPHQNISAASNILRCMMNGTSVLLRMARYKTRYNIIFCVHSTGWHHGAIARERRTPVNTACAGLCHKAAHSPCVSVSVCTVHHRKFSLAAVNYRPIVTTEVMQYLNSFLMSIYYQHRINVH